MAHKESHASTSAGSQNRRPATISFWQALLRPIASLKLTVALFVMAIFIVFAGTLAQTRMDIWEVVHEYFRASVAWIEFRVFFPDSFFPNGPKIPAGLGFYFPGGWLIGAVMFANLLSAHLLRFRVQAAGTRLMLGLTALGVGALMTWIVIAGGLNQDGVEETAVISWSTLWQITKASLVVGWFGSLYAFVSLARDRRVERRFLMATLVALGGLILWLYGRADDTVLGASSMRILWQLMQGGLASAVLWLGCALVFKRRAGIVLLHAGIMLLMFSELLVGTLAVEGQMHIREGETVDFVQDIRTLELAVVDPTDDEQDRVVVVPQSRLVEGATIRDPLLPFDLKVVKYFKNSQLRHRKPDEESPATHGMGLRWVAEPVRAGTGTDTTGEVDMAAAYVEVIESSTAKSLGTYLLGLIQSQQDLAERVTKGGRAYELALRFKRTYKPYSMRLIDVRHDKYLGTDKARNYSSELQLVDPTRNVDRTVKIWMNNPLRFAGETFYQSNFFRDPRNGAEATGLQVVTNAGWMIPYVSCMIVATGMLAQFSIVLLRFLRRRASTGQTSRPHGKPAVGGASQKSQIPNPKSQITPGGRLAVWAPLLVVVLAALWLTSKARVPTPDDGQMNLYEFGKLPLVYQGRVKPFDTLARNSLRIISDKQTFTDAKSGQREPAIRWLLDVITETRAAEEHQVFRIENLEVQETLGLKRRARYRYSVAELRKQMEEFEKQVRLARSLPVEQLSVYQKKVIELDRRIRTLTKLLAAFRRPAMPEIKDPESAKQHAQTLMRLLVDEPKRLAQIQPPLAVPIDDREEDWMAFSTAWARAYVQTAVLGRKANEATVALANIFAAYEKDDAGEFNQAVAAYRAALEKNQAGSLDLAKTDFEAFFNHFEPFYYCSVLYVFAFVLVAVGWLAWGDVMNRAAFWLIALTLVAHTFALVARIYISGRPPVTNLYSSAVFIGWGTVGLGLVLEQVYRLGIGNVVAALSGFATLLIAHFLAGDGDTFVVLQAVLDTQFWLATHVTTITIGYATTFVAGILGICYILRGVFTRSLSPEIDQAIYRMIYGTICFAIFFSFVGTVLGGLWADDSWGRFWGWDPKENGALIIVLWNALVLHARWDGMVKERGLAVLATAGNITTSWSWFGVNELGVGLHSYGFTEGVLFTLFCVVLVHLAIIGLGMLPRHRWRSVKDR